MIFVINVTSSMDIIKPPDYRGEGSSKTVVPNHRNNFCSKLTIKVEEIFLSLLPGKLKLLRLMHIWQLNINCSY